MKSKFILLVLVICPCFAVAQSIFKGSAMVNGLNNRNTLDGSGTLGMVYKKDTCGLNFVQSSVLTETRSIPDCNINGTGFPTSCAISGLPSCVKILKAYVWYVASYLSTSPPITTVVITNPNGANTNYPASLIGSGTEKCWGENGTAVYRSDVTASIAGNGNYSIDLTGFQDKNWEVDGVTLCIIYRDPLATYQGSLVLWDRNITVNSLTINQTITGLGTCSASLPGSGKAFTIISDRQENISNNQHTAVLNGNSQVFANDFWCWDQVNTSFAATQNNVVFSVDGDKDCFTMAMAGIYYQTNACITCTPSVQAIIGVNTTATEAYCNQSTGTAVATAIGGIGPYLYQWNTTPVQHTQTATGLASGTYSVIVTDATGCNIGIDTVVVPEAALADTLQITTTYCDGDTIIALYAPKGFTGYQWNLGTSAITGATTDSLLIEASQLNDAYSVNQIIDECVRHTSALVIKAPASFFVPDSTANVFTPNADGINDSFYPYINSEYQPDRIDYYAKNYDLKIYNRWGNLIFESTDYTISWTGENNNMAAAGTYYWMCSYINRCQPDKTVIENGVVNLIR